ncbi:unnamed protein product [Closterium sp. Naga37s-1]|nr:unnamed protein product [Closterium sp. Naga37s-1]
MPHAALTLLPRQGHAWAWAVTDAIPDLDREFAVIEPDMAMTFPFQLDTFQKEVGGAYSRLGRSPPSQMVPPLHVHLSHPPTPGALVPSIPFIPPGHCQAIIHLERHESVFVAAHTSAGKTVVAEYAFALAAKHCTRAVYTSPIKAISNQKFRDFSKRFDVGLLTGDLSVRPEAACLIMTTEILRSMLYRAADIIKDIEWVVFDEVHYVNDMERGVVWEEVIIMLPPHVGLIMLSATVPNTTEFADWIGRTKRKKIFVTGTTRRPVPLEHNIYYGGRLHRIFDRGDIDSTALRAVHAAHKAKHAPPAQQAGGAGRGGAGRGGGAGGQGGQQGRGGQVVVVVFCFSKRRCDESADSLTSVDLTSKSDKSAIVMFCNSAFARLKGSDRHLPQVERISELLRRGIGVHHAGLLPIVKEVVEMLFCSGLIRVLFSTETFAMGVNAPARTVAFHALKKHDGRSFRMLLPGEYTQMAGRAGRRGLDKFGTVIICCWEGEEVPSEVDLRRVLTGKATKLESQFRLSYAMILNLLRVEDLTVEDMLKRSFAEAHAQRLLPQQQKMLQAGEHALAQLANAQPISCILGDPSLIEQYYDVASEARELDAALHDVVMRLRQASQLLTPGRVVLVQAAETASPHVAALLKGPFGPTPAKHSFLVLSLPRSSAAHAPGESGESGNGRGEGSGNGQEGREEEGREEETRVGRSFNQVTVLGTGPNGPIVVNMRLPHRGTVAGTCYTVEQIPAAQLVGVCRAKVALDVPSLLEEVRVPAYAAAVHALVQVREECAPADPPLIDPIKDLKIADSATAAMHKRQLALRELLPRSPCHACHRLDEHYAAVSSRRQLSHQVEQLKAMTSDQALQQLPDFHLRVEVLQTLAFIDADRIVQLKGRVACEMNSADELLATECLLNHHLAALSPPAAVALLSAFVFQQKDASSPQLTAELAHARNKLLDLAYFLGDLQRRVGLPTSAEEYAAATLNFGLMEVVYEWALGTPFADICPLTNVAEGTIVRTILRLDETCREFRSAARLLGNAELMATMEAGSAAIKRDIVFAASLYVS